MGHLGTSSWFVFNPTLRTGPNLISSGLHRARMRVINVTGHNFIAVTVSVTLKHKREASFGIQNVSHSWADNWQSHPLPFPTSPPCLGQEFYSREELKVQAEATLQPAEASSHSRAPPEPGQPQTRRKKGDGHLKHSSAVRGHKNRSMASYCTDYPLCWGLQRPCSW
jgi:hypothetical protein